VREKKDHLYIFTEKVNSGSLSDLMKKRMEAKQFFSDEEVSHLMKGIMEAVNYIHIKDIVHRDIKPGFS
jgi:serine/threonine protein kinase